MLPDSNPLQSPTTSQRNCENNEECVISDQCMLNVTDGKIMSRVSCGVGRVCCDSELNYKIMEAFSCGLRNEIGAGFYGVAENENAQFAEFSWMASIEQGSDTLVLDH